MQVCQVKEAGVCLGNFISVFMESEFLDICGNVCAIIFCIITFCWGCLQYVTYSKQVSLQEVVLRRVSLNIIIFELEAEDQAKLNAVHKNYTVRRKPECDYARGNVFCDSAPYVPTSTAENLCSSNESWHQSLLA